MKMLAVDVQVGDETASYIPVYIPMDQVQYISEYMSGGKLCCLVHFKTVMRMGVDRQSIIVPESAVTVFEKRVIRVPGIALHEHAVNQL